MTIGFRILGRKNSVDLQTAKKFLNLPVANVSDCMSRLTAGGSHIRPMHKTGQLAGPALTIKTRPGDNLMLHKAIDLAEPGDIIVCDAGGDLTNSLMGELMLSHALKRGWLVGLFLTGLFAMRKHFLTLTCLFLLQESVIVVHIKMVQGK